MVDVGHKSPTARTASAQGRLVMAPRTLSALLAGRNPKGDPLTVARIAGIQAAKKTADLIPLCHTLALSSIDVEIEPDPEIPGLRATATARITDRTGVEMEALTAVTVALLTAYDMLKALDRGMRLEGITLLHKAGGRSGEWGADAPDGGTAGADVQRGSGGDGGGRGAG